MDYPIEGHGEEVWLPEFVSSLAAEGRFEAVGKNVHCPSQPCCRRDYP